LAVTFYAIVGVGTTVARGCHALLPKLLLRFAHVHGVGLALAAPWFLDRTSA
jgi:hypothetical protein